MKPKGLLSFITALSVLTAGGMSITAHADSNELGYEISYSSKYTYLTLTTDDEDNVIRYTTDGSAPDENSEIYENRLRTNKKVTVRAAVFDEDGEKRDSVKITLRRKCRKVEIKAYDSNEGIKIKLLTDTDGADIYYTTDGSKPDEDSKPYNGAFYAEEGDIIRAYAVKKGWKDSSYTKLSVPATEKSNEAETASASDEEIYGKTACVILGFINEERAEEGLEPLKLDKKLCEAAEIRAKELCDVYSHKRPDGSSCFTAFDDVGFLCLFGAENIAYTEGSLSTGSHVMELWMDSPDHRENILNEKGDLVGIAAVRKGNRTFWVQMFARAR